MRRPADAGPSTDFGGLATVAALQSAKADFAGCQRRIYSLR